MRTGVMVSSNQRWPRLFTILFILAVQMARTSAFCCESACALMRTEGNCTQTDPNDQCKVEDYGECKCIWITTTLSESSKQCLAEKLLPKGSNIQISMSVLVVVIPIIGSCCLCCCGCYCFFKWLGKGEDEDEDEDEDEEEEEGQMQFRKKKAKAGAKSQVQRGIQRARQMSTAFVEEHMPVLSPGQRERRASMEGGRRGSLEGGPGQRGKRGSVIAAQKRGSNFKGAVDEESMTRGKKRRGSVTSGGKEDSQSFNRERRRSSASGDGIKAPGGGRRKSYDQGRRRSSVNAGRRGSVDEESRPKPRGGRRKSQTGLFLGDVDEPTSLHTPRGGGGIVNDIHHKGDVLDESGNVHHRLAPPPGLSAANSPDESPNLQPVPRRREKAPAKFLDEDDDFPGPINLLPKEASTVAPPAPAPPVLEPEPEPESQEPERTEPEIEVGSEEAEVGSDMMEVEMPLPLAQPSFLVRGTPKFEDAVKPARPPAPAIDDPPVKLGFMGFVSRMHAEDSLVPGGAAAAGSRVSFDGSALEAAKTPRGEQGEQAGRGGQVVRIKEAFQAGAPTTPERKSKFVAPPVPPRGSTQLDKSQLSEMNERPHSQQDPLAEPLAFVDEAAASAQKIFLHT